MPKININGQYPCMANWVTLRRDGNKVIARNGLIDKDFKLTEREAKYLTCLNGNRDEYQIAGFSQEECEEYFYYLDSLFLIREPGRSIKFIEGETLHTLFIPDKKSTNSMLPKILNFLLWISFLPVFIYGLNCAFTYGIDFNVKHWLANFLIGYGGGLAIGMIFHELAHAVACLSNKNGRLFEAGIMINGIVPGAYVLIDNSRIKSRLKKVQIHLAGVEMNLLIAGILLIFMTSIRRYSSLYEWKIAIFYAVVQNVFLALINITFSEGLDGEHVISYLMGGSIVDEAKENIRQLFNHKKRKRYFEENGINGVARICVSFAILGFQLMIPLLIIANISVIGGFFL